VLHFEGLRKREWIQKRRRKKKAEKREKKEKEDLLQRKIESAIYISLLSIHIFPCYFNL